jgi:peptidoglycan hydrolase-like protein with peptidoglycan-binding domain
MRLNFFRRAIFPAYVLQTPGLKDDRILGFQRILNKRSARYNLHVDETGIYDDQTRAVVSSYQLRALSIINNDGLVGPQTAKKLGIRLIEDDFKT